MIDIFRKSFHWLIDREILHSIDKRRNPVHLITDKLRESRCASFSPVFQQLSGPPDAGQWILYLMRQNSRRPHGGARTIGGSAVGNLLRLAVVVFFDTTHAFMFGYRARKHTS